MTRPRKAPRTPGDEGALAVDPATGDTVAGEKPGSDPDAAIEAARRGEARRIAKPRVPLPAAPLPKGRYDPDRPASAAVNQKREMPYADAMRALNAGTLTRDVLTEKGWVVAPKQIPEKARRI